MVEKARGTRTPQARDARYLHRAGASLLRDGGTLVFYVSFN